MVSLWPRRLPQSIRDNPLRLAEVKVFDALAGSLGTEWTAFYSRPWLGLTSQGEEVDGEADFIVVHPEKGLLSIEVKGGRIDYDPAREQWTSTDRDNIVHNIKDPVGQARSAKHVMVKRLRESPHWNSRWLRARHGVIFPDCDIPGRDFGPDRPRSIFCDRNQFHADVAEWIEVRLASEDPEDREGSTGPGDDGVWACQKLLAEPLHFRVPLGHFLEEDDRSLGLLTEQQFHILDTMEDQLRVVVRGGAGTGKTVLATESARRRAEEGDRVLFVCFNRGLASHVGQVLQDTTVHTGTFHSLCREIAGEAKLQMPASDDPEFYENVLPEVLVEALETLPERRFDTVIVDEGQDFRSNWWPAVDLLLEGTGSRLQIFLDSNQKLYLAGDSLSAELSAQPWRLSRNLRNSDPIHDLTMGFYEGLRVLPSQVKGEEPEFLEADTTDLDRLARTIGERTSHLVEINSVPVNEIAVLTSSRGLLEQLERAPALEPLAFQRCDTASSEFPVLDTVRRFKGLEARVVILVADGDLLERPELPYVAFSRARTHLIILGQPEVLEYLRQKSA